MSKFPRRTRRHADGEHDVRSDEALVQNENADENSPVNSSASELPRNCTAFALKVWEATLRTSLARAQMPSTTASFREQSRGQA